MDEAAKTTEETDIDVPTLTEEDIAKIVIEMDDEADLNPVAGIDAIQKHVEESLLFLDHKKTSIDPNIQNSDQENTVKKIVWEPMKLKDKKENKKDLSESCSDENQVVSTEKSIDSKEHFGTEITKTVGEMENPKVTASPEIIKHNATVSVNENENMETTCVESNNSSMQIEEIVEDISEKCDQEVKESVKENIKKEIDIDVQAETLPAENYAFSTLQQTIADTTDKIDDDKDNLEPVQKVTLENTDIDTTGMIDSVSIQKEINISEDESKQTTLLKDSELTDMQVPDDKSQNETIDSKCNKQELCDTSQETLQINLPVKEEESLDPTHEMCKISDEPMEDDHINSKCSENVESTLNDDSIQQMDVTYCENIRSPVWETIEDDTETIEKNIEDQNDSNNILEPSIETKCAEETTPSEIKSEEETILGEDSNAEVDNVESNDVTVEDVVSKPKHVWENRVNDVNIEISETNENLVENVKNTHSNDSVKHQESKDEVDSNENSCKENLKHTPLDSTSAQPQQKTNTEETTKIENNSMTAHHKSDKKSQKLEENVEQENFANEGTMKVTSQDNPEETKTPLDNRNKQKSQTKRPIHTNPSNELPAKRARFESGSTDVSADFESNATIEDDQSSLDSFKDSTRELEPSNIITHQSSLDSFKDSTRELEPSNIITQPGYLSKKDIHEFHLWAPKYLKCNDSKLIAKMLNFSRRNKCVLRLGNLPKHYNFNDVNNLIRKYTCRGGAEISKSIAFIYNEQSQNPPGSTAYIKWRNKDMILVLKAMELIKMSKVILQGRLITCHYDERSEIEWNINERPIVMKNSVLPPVPLQKTTQKMDPFVNGEINPSDTKLYGLKVEFLSGLKIEPPLTCYVSVNNLDKNLDEIKVRNIFKVAGNILIVRLKVEGDSLKVWIQYEHPLEVVQAISMFDKQELNKRVIELNMEQKLPSQDLTSMGFTKLGPGLGTKGVILKGVAVNADLQYLKTNTANELFLLQRTITRYNTKIKDIAKDQSNIIEQNNTDEKTSTDVFEQSVSTNSAQNIIAALSSAISSSVQNSIMTILGFQSKGSTQNTPKSTDLPTNVPTSTQTSPQNFKNKTNIQESWKKNNMQATRNSQSPNIQASQNTQGTNMPRYKPNLKTVPNVQSGNMQVATNMPTKYDQNQTSLAMQTMQYNPNMQMPPNMQVMPESPNYNPNMPGLNMQVMPDMQAQYNQNMQAWQNMQQLSYMQTMMYMQNAQTVPTATVIQPEGAAYNPTANIQPVYPYVLPANQPSTSNIPTNQPISVSQPQNTSTPSSRNETIPKLKQIETNASGPAVIQSGPKLTKPLKNIIIGTIKKPPKPVGIKTTIPLPSKPQKRDASGLVIQENPVQTKSPQESVAWINKQIKAMRRNSKSPELSRASSPKTDKFGFVARETTSGPSLSRERELVILKEINKIKEAEKAKEKQREIERQKEEERMKKELEKRREVERIKEKQREIEREIERAKEKQRDIERQREMERAKEKQREIDRQRETDRMKDKYRTPDRFRDADLRPGTLIFKYLPSSVTSEDLRDKMAEIGKVNSAAMLGKGLAIVTFRYSRDAEICIDMYNRSKVDGQTIEVKWK